MTPRFWAGERESDGLASIYRGPILLAFDPRFDTLDPSDLPSLDAANLHEKRLQAPSDPPSPMLLLEYPAAGGRTIRLCDFASAARTDRPIDRGSRSSTYARSRSVATIRGGVGRPSEVHVPPGTTAFAP